MTHFPNPSVSRRGLLIAGASLAAAGAAGLAGAGEIVVPALPSATPAGAAGALKIPPENYRIKNGRIKHSAMGAVLGIPPDTLIDACHAMGMPAVEAIGNDEARLARVRGLNMSLGYLGSHGFVKGPLNPEFHAECEQKLRAAIELAARFGCANVITFTGMTAKGITDPQAASNCVEFWKKLMPLAEEKKVNLILEILNTRDDTHPMKGHPGYFGCHTDLCVDLIKKVDSPRMKLLFDVYHVQIMDGDVIRRIRQHKDYIAHVHVAGVPGRGELDDKQELFYPAVMRALLEIGYSGFVAQEFIPTRPDKLAALRHAVSVCDI